MRPTSMREVMAVSSRDAVFSSTIDDGNEK
jgi:hypothetical protein